MTKYRSLREYKENEDPAYAGFINTSDEYSTLYLADLELRLQRRFERLCKFLFKKPSVLDNNFYV